MRGVVDSEYNILIARDYSPCHTGHDSGNLWIIISKSWFAAASQGRVPRGEKLSANGIVIVLWKLVSAVTISAAFAVSGGML